MEGVLMAMLQGRSLRRDEGFLGRLALQLVEGIDAAHAKTSAPSDSEVLCRIVEELEVRARGSMLDGFSSPTSITQIVLLGRLS